MTRKKQRSRGSRGRSNTAGLLFVLAAAVLLGAGIGVFVGKEFGQQEAHSGAVSSPSPDVHSEPAREAPRHASEQARETRQVDRRDAEKRETCRAELVSRSKPKEPAQAKTTSVEEPKSPEPERHTPAAPTSRRRPAAMAGEISHVSGTMKVALTFDAGASAAPTPSILKTLETNGLRVTFFLTGKWAEQNEELVKRIRAEGHEIGNHTYSHPDLRKLSDASILEQLKKTDDIIARITGRECDPYFRPPYGGRDKRVLRVVADAGYTSVYWSLDSWDAFKKNITSKEIIDRVLGRIQGGDIVLMHCGSQATADALPVLVRELEARGYQIVKVSDLRG